MKANVLLRYKFIGVLAIFVVLILLVGFFSPGYTFTTVQNIGNLLSFGPELAIIVLGAGLLMIAGEFDLSVGSVLAFCAFVFQRLFTAGLHPLLSFIIVIAVGAVLGFINGIITVKAKILSFITTLGTMMLWRGLTLLLSGGIQSPCDTSAYPGFTALFSGTIGGFFPAQAVWYILIALLLVFLLHKHKFGNWVYSTGDNAMAARSMCINTDWVKIGCFMIVGALVALSSVIQIIRVAAFSSRVGTGWELRVIAAAVVGGTSLRGGRGTMIGIFLGACIIVIIENALTIMRLAYEWTFMVYGLVIMSAALLDLFIEKRKTKLAE